MKELELLVGRDGIELTSVHPGNLCYSITYTNIKNDANSSIVAMCEAGVKHAHVEQASDMG